MSRQDFSEPPLFDAHHVLEIRSRRRKRDLWMVSLWIVCLRCNQEVGPLVPDRALAEDMLGLARNATRHKPECDGLPSFSDDVL
jgi:hypothetical protein